MPTVLSLLALVLASATALYLDRQMVGRRLVPPLFAEPMRRAMASVLVAGLFYLGVFMPALSVGSADPGDMTSRPTWALFSVHFLLLVTVSGWYLLGFGRAGDFAGQFGLKTRHLALDLGLGVVGGGLGWLGMIAVMLVVVGLISVFAGAESLPQRPPEVIAWLAGLPWLVRLSLALSAGFFEELFFRGFLQPRIGLLASTAIFVLAHASYEQPTMLVGLTFLSLLFGWLARERQSIWPAVVAHAAFDAFQLLVVIPVALRFVPAAG